MEEYLTQVTARYNALDDSAKRAFSSFLETESAPLIAHLLGPEVTRLANQFKAQIDAQPQQQPQQRQIVAPPGLGG